jgi:hypothetical protein
MVRGAISKGGHYGCYERLKAKTGALKVSRLSVVIGCLSRGKLCIRVIGGENLYLL